MTELEKQLLAALKELRDAYQEFMGLPAVKANAAIAAAEEASLNYPAVPEGWALVKSPITEGMHRAAVKVLVRANGVDGLPQRMLEAMLATAPQATVKDSLIVQQAPAARLSYFAYDPDVGFEQFNTEAEAMVFAQAAIDAYRDAAGDGWDEDVENVCWGVVHGTTQQVAVEDDYDGRHGLGDMLFVDYILTGPAPAPAQVEQQAPGKWQPISTAPKNGMHILCYMETEFGGHIEPMYWSDCCWNYCFDGDSCQYTPSHWMPAPPAPTQEAGARLAAKAQEGGAA